MEMKMEVREVEMGDWMRWFVGVCRAEGVVMAI